MHCWVILYKYRCRITSATLPIQPIPMIVWSYSEIMFVSWIVAHNPSVVVHRFISQRRATRSLWTSRLSFNRGPRPLNGWPCRQSRAIRKPNISATTSKLPSHLSLRAYSRHLPFNMLSRFVPILFFFTHSFICIIMAFCRKVWSL